MSFAKSLALIVLLVMAAGMGGCGVGDFTAGPPQLEKTVDPVYVQQHARAGRVYCMRGWLGIFSKGMIQLSDKLNDTVGVTSLSVADMDHWKLEEWLLEQYKAGKMDEPLVLLGHSYGADDMIRVSKSLGEKQITVDLLVLIDPVNPPAATANVKRVYCIYKSNPGTDALPWWRGVAASVEDPNATSLENIDLRTADIDFKVDGIVHPYIDKFEGVHDMAIKEIEKVCPPRAEWTLTHPPKTGTGQTTPQQATTMRATGAGKP